MTKKEKIIVSAYTGYLMCDFNSMHEYIEKVLGRPVFTHELIEKTVHKEIKEKVKPDFVKLCEAEPSFNCNPVEAAYKLLVAYRDANMIPDMGTIEELIGHLGEALA